MPSTINARDTSMGSTPSGDPSPTAIPLGPLESTIMDIVWALGTATVRDVHRVLSARRDIAYTTVMTTMSNLARKNVLQRYRRDRAYVYNPTFSREEFSRSKVASLVDALMGRFTEPAMTYLVDRLAQVDPHSLIELEQAIAKLRKERRGMKSD